jgi:hypothetical protein
MCVLYCSVYLGPERLMSDCDLVTDDLVGFEVLTAMVRRCNSSLKILISAFPLHQYFAVCYWNLFFVLQSLWFAALLASHFAVRRFWGHDRLNSAAFLLWEQGYISIKGQFTLERRTLQCWKLWKEGGGGLEVKWVGKVCILSSDPPSPPSEFSPHGTVLSLRLLVPDSTQIWCQYIQADDCHLRPWMTLYLSGWILDPCDHLVHNIPGWLQHTWCSPVRVGR